MLVKVISVFEYHHIKKEAWVYIAKGGQKYEFKDEPERTAKCALVELQDGEGVRVKVEIPAGYSREVKVGDLLFVECGQLSKVTERPLIIANISRHTVSMGK